MIIHGSIFATDIGKQDTIFHLACVDGPVACYAKTEDFEIAVRMFAKNKQNILVKGHWAEIKIYSGHNILAFKVEDILMGASRVEDFEFLLTGAL